MNFEKLIDLVVTVSGFVSWTIFLPQIRLLLDVKKSDSVSLGLVWGSFALQSLILIQSLIKRNWPLVFVMMTGVCCLGIILFLIYRYRKYPGGKPEKENGQKN